MKFVKFTSWNGYSTRFVHAPEFRWQKVDSAVIYRVGVASAKHRHAAWFETKEPVFDFEPIWKSFPHGRIDMLIHAFDSHGHHVEETSYRYGKGYAPKSFFKVPGWNGDMQKPMDWDGTVKRNIDYLLRPAKGEIKPYEIGLPRHVWNAAESFAQSITGKGEADRLTYPSRSAIILAALFRFAKQFPQSPLANEAVRQAKQYGEWLLTHHLPAEYVYSGFPFSTLVGGIMDDNYGGHIEGKNISVNQAALIGSGMIRMSAEAGDSHYLDYAVNLANVYVKTQQDDGTWPSRVDPKTGKMGNENDDYDTSAVRIASFLLQLEAVKPDKAYQESRNKALDWILNNPVKTRYWQSAFEDVSSRDPFQNLSAWDTLPAIRYLLHFRNEIPKAVEIALQLNDFVEDQFVVWNAEESNIKVQCPTPTVLEQYDCYSPMEVHTGNWLLSLAALHQATGDKEFLKKGVAAANSICQGEHNNGMLSTWGLDERFNWPLSDSENWPSCNASASNALMLWTEYYQSVKSGKSKLFDWAYLL